ncbi:hypothetical protein F5Y15DRAFT_418164 [Xylariaceae sp. FL0016]|nr:hypothetical protein F5Y15DRAFT_418164 [Xylariaceae sp. FL0016]
MECVSGGTVEDWIQKMRRQKDAKLPTEDMLWIWFLCRSFGAVLRTEQVVQDTHPSRLAHQDMHTGNVMFGDSVNDAEHRGAQILKLIHFGFSGEIMDGGPYAAIAKNIADAGVVISSIALLEDLDCILDVRDPSFNNRPTARIDTEGDLTVDVPIPADTSMPSGQAAEADTSNVGDTSMASAPANTSTVSASAPAENSTVAASASAPVDTSTVSASAPASADKSKACSTARDDTAMQDHTAMQGVSMAPNTVEIDTSKQPTATDNKDPNAQEDTAMQDVSMASNTTKMDTSIQPTATSNEDSNAHPYLLTCASHDFRALPLSKEFELLVLSAQSSGSQDVVVDVLAEPAGEEVKDDDPKDLDYEYVSPSSNDD